MWVWTDTGRKDHLHPFRLTDSATLTTFSLDESTKPPPGQNFIIQGAVLLFANGYFIKRGPKLTDLSRALILCYKLTVVPSHGGRLWASIGIQQRYMHFPSHANTYLLPASGPNLRI